MKKYFYINGRFLTQPLTGVQRFAYEITTRLLLSDDVVVLVPNAKLNPNYNIKGWNIKKIGFGSGYFWEQIILPVYLILHNSPLLICLCNLSPIFYKNKISVIHDVAVIEHPEWFNRKFVFFYRFSLKRIAWSSKAIVTVSDFSKQRIENFYKIDSNNIEVIHNAVAANLLGLKTVHFSNQNLKAIIRKKFILCVASLDPRKNFKNILASFNLLDFQDIELVIVGKQSSVFNTVDFETRKNTHIHFVGYLSDIELFWLYKHAILFVYLSLYEGFGIPPLEAMASGCPVLLSDIPVHRELFEDAALFVNPLSVQDIANGISYLLNNIDLRNELIAQGYKISSRFNWDKSAGLFMQLIKKIKGVK